MHTPRGAGHPADEPHGGCSVKEGRGGIGGSREVSRKLPVAVVLDE